MSMDLRTGMPVVELTLHQLVHFHKCRFRIKLDCPALSISELEVSHSLLKVHDDCSLIEALKPRLACFNFMNRSSVVNTSKLGLLRSLLYLPSATSSEYRS
jgi:hypothetical protein